jgi:hypothetical protein
MVVVEACALSLSLEPRFEFVIGIPEILIGAWSRPFAFRGNGAEAIDEIRDVRIAIRFPGKAVLISGELQELQELQE